MSNKVCLGIDIGTTATKAVLIDCEASLLAQVEKQSGLTSRYVGWAEEDAGRWWENVCQVIPQCLRMAGVAADRVSAVGVSGMVPALILVDSAGKVLRPSIQQNDARATAEIDTFLSFTTPAAVLAQTGSLITQQSIGPKLLWLKRNEPQVFAETAHVMGSYDFIVYRLTGKFSIERNWALESGLLDLRTDDWSDEMLALSGIGRRQLGRLHWPAEVVGGLTPEAARLTGLVPGTPVVAGCADHIASAFSAGLNTHGDLLVKLGGSGDLLYSLETVVIEKRLYLDYHVIPGKFILNGCMASSGSLIQWYLKNFSTGSSLVELEGRAGAIPPGSDGLILLPYFLGEKTPLHDPFARGTLVGLTLSHTPVHIYRAILEGISYGFLHHMQVLEQRGLDVRLARVTNGGARSQLWKQITADVLGLRLEQIAHHPGSSLGAAFIAGKGVGEFSDWAEIERYIQVSGVIEPDPQRHAFYLERFEIFREIYEALKDKYPRLN